MTLILLLGSSDNEYVSYTIPHPVIINNPKANNVNFIKSLPRVLITILFMFCASHLKPWAEPIARLSK